MRQVCRSGGIEACWAEGKIERLRHISHAAAGRPMGANKSKIKSTGENAGAPPLPYQLEELWARIGIQLRLSGTDSYIQTVWSIGFKLAEG